MVEIIYTLLIYKPRLELKMSDISCCFFFPQVIKDMTNGGADYCFECIGLASVMAEAFNSSRDVCSLFISLL